MDHSLHSYLMRLPTETLEWFLKASVSYEELTPQHQEILLDILEILGQRYKDCLC